MSARGDRKGSGRRTDSTLPPRGANAEWVWRDDNKQLDFVCRSGVKGPPKRKLSRGPIWQKIHSSAATSSVTTDDSTKLKVTLKNVKMVAVECINSELIHRMSTNSVLLFDLYFKSEQINRFLWYLLLYMDAFFKLELQGLDKPRMFRVGENAEPQADLARSLCQYRLALAETYCEVVLGLGLESFHHMKSGKSRTSSSKSDRESFEAFYEFLMCAVWVTFHRQHWQLIHREVGRLLRSFSFNRSIYPEQPGEVDSADEEIDVDKTFVKSFTAGRLHHKFAPIMEAVMPNINYKDSSVPPSSHSVPAALLDTKSNLAGVPHSKPDLREFQKGAILGIIGEPLSKYNKDTLLPAEDSDSED